MKLASLKSGRDGELIVVSRDLALAVRAGDIAPTLQFALDNWAEATPALEQRSADLSTGNCSDTFEFEPAACAAPLPRAYHWADGSAYVTHVELVRKARGAELPESFWTDPLIYMGASDAFIGSRDHIEVESEDWGIDFEAEVVVITDDVPAGVSPEQAGEYIRLVGLGRVVGKQATEQGIARAKETGMCCVALGNASHLGRIGKFGERCADEGMVSMHYFNVVGHDPIAVAYGGRDRRFGTNPFCCVVPRVDGKHVVLDMATTTVAAGKV